MKHNMKNRYVRAMVESLESRTMLSALTTHATKVVAKPHVLPVTHIVITQQPMDVTGGQIETMVVTLEDMNGNTVTTATDKLTVKIATGPKGGQLFGTLTVKAVDGVATFNAFSLGKIGTYTLKAVDGSKTAVSDSVLVTLGAPAKLKLISEFPVDTAARLPTGSLGPIVVNVTDPGGNVVNTPTVLTFPIVTTAGNGWTVAGTFVVGEVVTQANSGAKGLVTAVSARNVSISVTSGTFEITDVVTGATSGATLTATGTPPSLAAPQSQVTVVVDTTLSTEAKQGTVTQAATGTATTINGVATITLTGTTSGSATLGLKPGWYLLTVTDPGLPTIQSFVYVR